MNPIEGNNPLATSRLGRGVAPADVQRGSRNGGAESSGVTQADQAAISNRGRFVGAAIQSVLDSPDVRSERVAALKAAIADGTYHSNPRAVASRLLGGGTFEGDWK